MHRSDAHPLWPAFGELVQAPLSPLKHVRHIAGMAQQDLAETVGL